MFYQDGLTGSAWGDWSLYTDSPLRAFESELGVQAPVGYWDPVGLSKDGDADAFKRRRVTEIKHGRVSMFACLGYIVPEYVKWPGYCSPSAELAFADVPNGLLAISKVPAAGWTQIFLFCGLVEKGLFTYDPSRAPGDYENGGVLGVPNGSTLPAGETKTRKLAAEIANGRLAMVAIIGMFYQDGLTGSAWGDWSLYTDSPLRAFESELGVQAPVGFWDPLGLAKDGDAGAFRRRRAIELKHGRVSMLACLGYITPEYFKFPGYCAPSSNLAFADIPNGLGALSKLPAAGVTQFFLFCGLIERGLYEYDPSRAPGDYANGGVLGVPNGSTLPAGEAKNRKLNSELANGRLAMMAIMGMMFQDGLTGSPWGDWALYTDSPLRAKGGADATVDPSTQVGATGDADATFDSSTQVGATGDADATFDPSTQVGATDPLGFWDPCGFCKDKDRATFRKYRIAELKHGRVAMLCIVGFFNQSSWRFSGFEKVPDGVKALTSAPAAGGFACLFLLVGFFELRILADLEKGSEPGDFGDPLNAKEYAGKDAFERFWAAAKPAAANDETWRNFELNHGRLAMIGAIGAITANWYTGRGAFEQWQAAKPAAISFIKTTIPFAP